jgi:hypothetical protein
MKLQKNFIKPLVRQKENTKTAFKLQQGESHVTDQWSIGIADVSELHNKNICKTYIAKDIT